MFIAIEKYFPSEAEFLAEIATLEGSFTGITYWYIGLTDLGKYLHI